MMQMHLDAISNRVYDDYEILADAVCQMWQDLSSERIKSVCRYSWLHEH
jgi:hypothetical protein